MRISRNWLADFIDISSLKGEEFAEIVTTRVAEVEGIEEVATSLNTGSVAKILAISPIPEKKNLKLVRLQLGGQEVQVVCGATNVREGQSVAYLPPGSSFLDTDGKKINVETREVGGVSSAGLLVSEAELGLTSDHSGVLVLESEPGAKLSEHLGEPDFIIEIDNKSLTHRPDLWSHFGFARELAAITASPLLKNPDEWADDQLDTLAGLGKGNSNFAVEIDQDCGCRRFAGLELTSVKTIPSPLWMRRRLHAVGAGVRNLLVDLSNYVMHDVGQPNHAYDADKLQGETIRVRLAREGEKFLGLDEEERELSAEDIVISDANGAVGLGGVMGGGLSSVSDSTTRLFLESANFDPIRIRKTTKRQSLRTDASNRFEKSRSVHSVPLALFRFTELLFDADQNAKAVGSVIDNLLTPQAVVQVPKRFDYIRQRLGAELSDERIERTLSALNFKIESDSVTVPYYRATRDISIVDDLVEEVGRTLGYENVPESAPQISSEVKPLTALYALENKMRNTLAGAGFYETYGYSFMGEEQALNLGYDTAEAVRLANPVDSTQSLMRTTLVPGLLEVAKENLKSRDSFGIFELGRAYHSELDKESEHINQAGFERRLLSFCYSSGVEEKVAGAASKPKVVQGADFYAACSLVDRLLKQLGISARRESLSSKNTKFAADFSSLREWMHSGRAGKFLVSDVVVANVAEVSPAIIRNKRVIIAELDLDALLKHSQKNIRFESLSKYPSSFFEMSVVMPKAEEFRSLKNLIESSLPEDNLRNIEVLAVYEGKPLGEGEKSVSVKISLGSQERTLKPTEIDSLQSGLMKAVEDGAYSLRS